VKRLLVLLSIFLAACAHNAPPGQPPMAAMDLAALRADFNAAAVRPRLILLLSPT
jgi:hypothetical protein